MKKTLKTVLEDLITTANFQPSSNCVGTRTPDGGLQKPSVGPQKAKGKWKLKKKAKTTTIQQRTMNPDPKKPGSPFAVTPAVWEDK